VTAAGPVIGQATATVSDGSWPWAIIDEAYQMRSDMLIRIAGRFERALFVGDPGQLDPFSTIDIDRLAGLTWDPMQSAVAVLLRNNPDISTHRLPVSWRLPDSAAPVVAEAFYPFTGFLAGTGPGERRLEFATRALGAGPVDEAVQTAAASGWALYELPARHTVRTDGEAVAACAALAERFLQRGTVACSERAPGGAPVTADRIAIGTAHRDQARAIRAALAPGLDDITVDTANRLQGAGVRRGHRAASAVGQVRRHRVPPGGGPLLRADLPAPACLRGGGQGRHSGVARRPSIDGAGAPERPGQIPRRLGSQPGSHGPPGAPPGASALRFSAVLPGLKTCGKRVLDRAQPFRSTT
jgi:hypothetical protein